ncbi:Protein RRNAD1 [Aphelenchoides besseyi]|nr:Protein RRNAD1 [Aphelenchoides besseyi]
MSDYFVEDHWTNLPTSIRSYFDRLIASASSTKTVVDVVEGLLDRNSLRLWPTTEVPPLLLISLKVAINVHALPQHKSIQSPNDITRVLGLTNSVAYPKFDRLQNSQKWIIKGIKKKKLHEIERVNELIILLTELCKEQGMQIDEIVDIGAGIGHLSRILSIHLTIPIQTVEGNEQYVRTAVDLDVKTQKAAKHKGSELQVPNRRAVFINEHKQIGNKPNANSLLVGLHTCGDLSPIIIRSFVSNSNAKSLVNFGCCYHNLNGGHDKTLVDFTELASTSYSGFPMSNQYADVKLTYASRELACSDNERFLDRLRQSTKEDGVLFVNPYRAALEWLVLGLYDDTKEHILDPLARHQRMRPVKHATQMDFWSYAKLTTTDRPEQQKLIERLETNKLVREKIEQMMSESKYRVLLLYALRQMVAPVIESLILVDRKTFLEEMGNRVFLIPLFDSFLSPRNLALIAIKRS